MMGNAPFSLFYWSASICPSMRRSGPHALKRYQNVFLVLLLGNAILSFFLFSHWGDVLTKSGECPAWNFKNTFNEFNPNSPCPFDLSKHDEALSSLINEYQSSWATLPPSLFDRLVHLYHKQSIPKELFELLLDSPHRAGALASTISSSWPLAGTRVVDMGSPGSLLPLTLASKGALICAAIQHNELQLELARESLKGSGLEGALLTRDDNVRSMGRKIDVVTGLHLLESAPLEFWDRYFTLGAYLLRFDGELFLSIPNPLATVNVLRDPNTGVIGSSLLSLPDLQQVCDFIDCSDKGYGCLLKGPVNLIERIPCDALFQPNRLGLVEVFPPSSREIREARNALNELIKSHSERVKEDYKGGPGESIVSKRLQNYLNAVEIAINDGDDWYVAPSWLVRLRRLPGDILET